MAIAPALQKVYGSNPAGAYYIEALSLYHSGIKDLHLTNTPVGFKGSSGSGNVADFVPIPFTVKLPPRDTRGSQQMEIAFSNSNQSLIDEFELMASKPYEPLRCFYRVFVSDRFDATGTWLMQQLNPAIKMEISGVNVRESTIAGIASRINSHNMPCPSILYTTANFPGLKI